MGWAVPEDLDGVFFRHKSEMNTGSLSTELERFHFISFAILKTSRRRVDSSNYEWHQYPTIEHIVHLANTTRRN